jgi:hypothetical protein
MTMNLILRTVQISKEYNEDGTVREEIIQSSNYEIKDGDESKGNVHVFPGGFSMNVYSVDTSQEGFEDKLNSFLESL